MKIAVIGGGAAGMMAAIAAGEACLQAKKTMNCEISLFEKNDQLGTKVLLSGGGRCNVTTGISDLKKVLENYPRGAKFLRTAMYDYPPGKVISMFVENGVKMKTEEDMRVFPASNNGKTVVALLEDLLNKNGVKILLKTVVVSIGKSEDGESFAIKTKAGGVFAADKVILTTGGSAYQQTGSSGDGYSFAKPFGHKITPLAPSLSSFVLKREGFPSGVSFQKVELKLMMKSEKVYQRCGSCLFTHTGISGPAVFALSGMVAYEKITNEFPSDLLIDFFPDESMEVLDVRLLKLLDLHGKKRLINIVDMLLPHSFCPVFIKKCHLDADLPGGKVNRDQRRIILKNLKSFQTQVIGRSAGEEFVTAGGVDLEEVDYKSMQSKIVPGLYFAGEILDIDGFTGGFNLQAAWATGRLAGKSAAKDGIVKAI